MGKNIIDPFAKSILQYSNTPLVKTAVEQDERKHRIMKNICILLAALLFLCGCSKSVKSLDRREEKKPQMSEAGSSQDTGELDSAIALYREILEGDPKIAKAHLDIAVLLHDHKRKPEDYAHAVYYYQRYLELRPETEKKRMIKKRIQNAMELLAEEFGYSEAGKLNAELGRAKRELDKRAGIIAELEKDVQELKKKIDQLEK